jgi:signal transduction histidine kinase
VLSRPPTVPVSRIARKLTALTVLASTTALLLAGLILMVYDLRTFREMMRQQRTIQAQIIGANTTSALVFDDPGSAERTLEALRAAPRIEVAAVYTIDGHLFASYMRDAAVAAIHVPDIETDTTTWHRFDALTHLHVVHHVVSDGTPLGRVYIRSDLGDQRERLATDGLVLGGVLLLSLLAAQAVSGVSRRAIAAPIVAMADTARRLAVDQDYSIRVTATAHDELGELIASFNAMLDQIEDRDRALRESHDLLEQRVHERTQALNESNKELEAFCYSVSHDLRAPLRSIDGFGAALLEDLDGKLDDASANHLRRIRAATQRMGTLIDDLLSLSRVNRSALAIKPVDLTAMAQAVVAELRSIQPDRQVEVLISDGLDALGDARLLRQLLDNLIGNAWKFTSTRPEAFVEFGVRSDQGEPVYFVRDNGVGFDPAYAQRLFGVFQRLHAMTEFPGTGVGLAIVERVVHRHGGRVWATAEVGRGATFYFTLATSAAAAA